MKVVRKTGGLFMANSYIVFDENSGEACLIDAGGYARPILDKCRELGKKLTKILITHGHFDHLTALAKLKEETECSVYIHEADAAALSDPRLNLSDGFFLACRPIKADVLLKDGDVVEAAGLSIRVLHTPGHTPGGVCYVCGSSIFSGDTLFKLSVGRTDFPQSSYEQLADSIRSKLFVLPGDYTVYPGHGPHTSLQFERENNVLV